MKHLTSIVAFIVLLILGGVLFIYSGTFDIAATSPHGSLMTWVMTTTRENAVSSKARGIKAPSLNDAAMISRGFDHYQEHCEVCHGAPGNYPSEIGAGMNPRPPKLWEAAKQLSPGEIFWVVKNGIKMTGMPAGTDHTDPEIWDIVAFVKKLPTITPQDYAKMAKASKANDHGGMADMPGMQGHDMGGMEMPGHDHHTHAHKD